MKNKDILEGVEYGILEKLIFPDQLIFSKEYHISHEHRYKLVLFTLFNSFILMLAITDFITQISINGAWVGIFCVNPIFDSVSVEWDLRLTQKFSNPAAVQKNLETN